MSGSLHPLPATFPPLPTKNTHAPLSLPLPPTNPPTHPFTQPPSLPPSLPSIKRACTVRPPPCIITPPHPSPPRAFALQANPQPTKPLGAAPGTLRGGSAGGGGPTESGPVTRAWLAFQLGGGGRPRTLLPSPLFGAHKSLASLRLPRAPPSSARRRSAARPSATNADVGAGAPLGNT